jgi:hypothetical protein
MLERAQTSGARGPGGAVRRVHTSERGSSRMARGVKRLRTGRQRNGRAGGGEALDERRQLSAQFGVLLAHIAQKEALLPENAAHIAEV